MNKPESKPDASSSKTPAKRGRGRPRTKTSEDSVSTVQALERALILLQVLSKKTGVTLSDLSLQVGLPSSTAYRLLHTLQQRGFVDFDDQLQEWSIGLESFTVGSSYLRRTSLVNAAHKMMRQLMNETGETANLAITAEGDVIFVAQVETHNPIRAFHRPGSKGHVHTSGIGKALLAELPRSEVELILQKKGLPEFTANTLTDPTLLFADLDTSYARGWAFDDEERYLGMRCVAAAIHDAAGDAVAGISVSGPTIRFPDDSVAQLGPKVRNAADAVTQMIGGVIPDYANRER